MNVVKFLVKPTSVQINDLTTTVDYVYAYVNDDAVASAVIEPYFSEHRVHWAKRHGGGKINCRKLESAKTAVIERFA